MPSHSLAYEILGASAQTLEVILDPGETVIAEAGVMNYLTDGTRFETRLAERIYAATFKAREEVRAGGK